MRIAPSQTSRRLSPSSKNIVAVGLDSLAFRPVFKAAFLREPQKGVSFSSGPMPRGRLRGSLLLAFGLAVLLPPRAAEGATAGVSAAETEVGIVASIRQAAGRSDDRTIDENLSRASALDDSLGSSAVVARRAAHACGWLRNDNEYMAAERLARHAIQQLARMSEDDEASRAERLYWEAWLEAEVLGNRKRAVDLALEAEKLAPDDERILGDSYRWAKALAEFGS